MDRARREAKTSNHPVPGRARRHKVICGATGKRRYRDGDDAGLALRRLKGAATKADRGGGAHRIRVERKYPCTACGGWHLTSWPTPDAPAPARADAA